MNKKQHLLFFLSFFATGDAMTNIMPAQPTSVGPITEGIFGQTRESASSDLGGFPLSPSGPVPLATGEL